MRNNPREFLDTPLVMPRQPIDGAKERELIKRLERGDVAVRYYTSLNVATSMAAKLNRRWANHYLDMDVHVYTQTCAGGVVGVYVQRVDRDTDSEKGDSRGEPK